MDLDDVRVAQGRGETGLVQEHLHELLIAGQLRQHPLDDHQLLEPLGADPTGQEDLGHAAGCDGSDELVGAVALHRRVANCDHPLVGLAGNLTHRCTRPCAAMVPSPLLAVTGEP